MVLAPRICQAGWPRSFPGPARRVRPGLCSWPAWPMLAWMTDTLEPNDAEDRKLCDRLAGRVGRKVEGVASVRPATRDGWISWVGIGVDDSVAPILTAAVAFTATLSAQERRRARATGLATRMALAVTEHEAHLFRTRAMGRIIGDHVLAVPYGMVTGVTVGKTASARLVASLVEGTVGHDGVREDRGFARKRHDRTHGRLEDQARRRRPASRRVRAASGRGGCGPSRHGRAGAGAATGAHRRPRGRLGGWARLQGRGQCRQASPGRPERLRRRQRPITRAEMAARSSFGFPSRPGSWRRVRSSR